MTRHWRHYIEAELRRRPLQTILWFLMGHVLMIALITLTAGGILLITTGASLWAQVFGAVAGVSFLAFFVQAHFFRWLYPPNDRPDPGPGEHSPLPFPRRRDAA